MTNHYKQQHKPNNSTMADKLGKVFSNRKPRPAAPMLKRLMDLVGDGEDHINIYLDCKTELGSKLSPFTVIPFAHPLFGKFDCRQGLFYYLLSEIGDEAFRTYNPKRMRAYATEHGNMGKFYPNLRYHLAVAQWLQIKNNEALKQQIIDNQLPYDAYFIRKIRGDNAVSHIPSRPNTNAPWIIAIVNIIANALKRGEEPNFDSFIDNKAELEKLRNKITRPIQTPPPPKKSKQKPLLTEMVDEEKPMEQGEVDVTDDSAVLQTADVQQEVSVDVVQQETFIEPVMEQVAEPTQEQPQSAPSNSYYD